MSRWFSQSSHSRNFQFTACWIGEIVTSKCVSGVYCISWKWDLSNLALNLNMFSVWTCHTSQIYLKCYEINNACGYSRTVSISVVVEYRACKSMMRNLTWGKLSYKICCAKDICWRCDNGHVCHSLLQHSCELLTEGRDLLLWVTLLWMANKNLTASFICGQEV